MRTFKSLLFAVLVFVCTVSSAQNAQYATSGTGSMRNYISWFDWAGFSLANGASRNFTTPDGLNVTISFSNVTASSVSPYIMNTWSGSVLWKLYDFTNPAVKPALFSINSSEAVTFQMSLSATRDGVPAPFTLVAADAEASDNTEVMTLSTNGSSWRTIEFYRNSSQNNNPLGGCGTQTVTLTQTYGGSSQTGQNPILATDGTGSIVVTTAMNRTMQGGMAVAFGIFSPIDRGDLPASYTVAHHALAFNTINSCNYNPPYPSISQTNWLYLGTLPGDADGAQTTNDNTNGADEDALTSFPVYTGSGSYSLTIPLRNTSPTAALATLKGWFDFNRDGSFSAAESATASIPGGATSAVLTWTGLPATLPAGSVSDFGFRFRTAFLASQIANPNGYATDGEAEDYLVAGTALQPPAMTTASFNAPDTVCLGSSVTITNTSTGTTSSLWNFCSADPTSTPSGINFGNPGSTLGIPVFMDYIQEGGNWYGLVVNNGPGGLVRLNFGSSLQNTPTATYLGNLGGELVNSLQGIQIVNHNGNILAIIVGGDPVFGVSSRVIKLNFGSSILNTPTVTNWGNIGSLDYPVELYLFKEGSNWYGLTENHHGNSITRFNFGTDFSGTPTGVNLGNIGGIFKPSGFLPTKQGGNWYLFVTNQGGNTLSRLDFGNSLLNTPTGVNLGNPGGILSGPRDIHLVDLCGQKVGFLLNGGSNSLVRLNFATLTSVPTATDLGNIGNMSGPHSFSRIFREGANFYAFVQNASSNTITRLNFTGSCTTGVTPAFSNLYNPPAITYTATGTYTISLLVDEGLPTQTSFCRQIVVMPPLVKKPTQVIPYCGLAGIKIGSPVQGASYLWNTGATTDSIFVNLGTYWVESSKYGCTVRDSIIVKCVQASFTAPDTICINNPVTINNTSTGHTTSLWNFCSSDPAGSPTGINLGNPGSLGIPVFIDYIQQGGNWYALVLNNGPGGLVRLNFGSSLLNTPTSTYLGNLSGVIVNSLQGIQIVNNNGNILAIVVGGDPVFGVSSRVIKLDFGASITNTPVATNWGNVGNLDYPVELYVFKEGANWYGITENHHSSTITRFNFGTDFNAAPTGENLGNIGGLNKPSGFLPVQIGGNWHLFVTNFGSNTLSRLDFGNSLLNTPTGINLGNLGVLSGPRDLHIVDLCGQKVGFLLNGSSNSLVRLNFSSPTAVPTASSLGNIGNMSGPHSFSRIFREGAGFYAFVQNASSNTLTRLNFTGTCASGVTPAFSTVHNPPLVTYSAPGTYTISLLVDEGLPTQTSFCKNIVVVSPPVHSPTQNVAIPCGTGQVKIGSSIKPATYLWSTGATTDSITVSSPGIYWVESSRYGCSVRDSFQVAAGNIDADFGFQQNICSPRTVNFSTSGSNIQSLEWNFGDGQTNMGSLNPVVTYGAYGTYPVRLIITTTTGCIDTVIKNIAINAIQNNNLLATNDTTICAGSSLLVRQTATGLTNCFATPSGNYLLNRDTTVTPAATTTYYYTVLVNSSNLVVNGDFSQGNTGFTSDYAAVPTNTTEGEYTVGNAPTSWNNSFQNCRDHTSASGNMMMVNGSPVGGKIVWSQTITVNPNTTYAFSTWIQSLFSVNPANLRFSINNTVIGNNITAGSTCQWQRFNTSWNSGNSTTAVISIVNNNTLVMGNDFALDDIYFGATTMQTDSLKVTVLPKPVIDVTPDATVCAGTAVQLNTVTTGTSVTWTPSTYLSDPSILNPIATPPSTIKYYAEANAGSGCSSRDSVTITVLRKPVVLSIADTAVCAGSSIVLQTSISDATQIQWQPSSSLNNSSIASPTASPTSFTEYIVTATNNGMCAVKDSVKVNVKPLPVVTLTNDTTVCGTASVQLQATGGGTYSWSPATGLSSTSISNPVAQPASTTEYKVTVTGANGCPVIDSVTIQVSPAPVFSISPQTQAVCEGAPITITASGGDVYNWTPAPGITNPNQPAITLTPTASGSYTVNISHTACKVNQTLTASVQVNPLPVVTVSKSGDVTCLSLQSQLAATGGSTYLWTPAASLSNPAIANPVASPLTNTTYTVKVGSPEGCFTESSITVNFLGGTGSTFYIPNAFTPNGDGLNDEFRPYFPGVQKFKMLIFNGWGELIYKTTDINKGWDGVYKGRKQGTDVYVYVLTAEGICGGSLFRKGSFLLIR